MNNSDAELRRAKDLYQGKVLDRASYDRAVANYEASRQQFEEATSNLMLSKLGPRKEEIAVAAAEIARVRARMARIRDDLAKTVIRSPFTGFLTEKWVEVGQWVQKGGRVAEVIELKRVLVRVPISERQISLVRAGAPARVIIDALDGRSFLGRIRNVIPKADPRSRTFPVEVELENTPRFDIKAGMFARLVLEYGEASRSVLVPKDAILLRTREAAVFVFDKGRVREVRFQPGRSVDSFFEVPRGVLKPGMRVVVKGNESLRNGMTVRTGADQPRGKGRPGAPGKKPSAGGSSRKRPKG